MDYLQQYLESNGASCDHQGTHSIYLIPFELFQKLPVQRWKYNRPPDADRVAEIHEWMKISKRMDGVLYLAMIDNILICYESNHRREALKGLTEMNHILTDILWNADDDMVKAEFQRLNKAVSVPELYIEQPSNTDEIRNLVDTFCKTHKKLKVNSGKPQRPNFNRDMVTDEFTRVMREKSMTCEQLVHWLGERNRELSNRDKSNLPNKILQKCEETGLWLFAWSSKLD
jgi:hypothetical protein